MKRCSAEYFDGINKHDYAEYLPATLNPQPRRRGKPQSTFDSGYSSTTDSGMTLTSLAQRQLAGGESSPP